MRRAKFRALGGSRVYKGAIWGKQIGNPGYSCVVRGTRPRKQSKSAKCLPVTSGQTRVPSAGTHRCFSLRTLSECRTRSRGDTKLRGSAPLAGTCRFWLPDQMRDGA